MKSQPTISITDVVFASLSKTTPEGFGEVLNRIAEAVEAFGCVLWQVAPGAELKTDRPYGSLFVVAEWFADQRYDASHDLPIAGSVTGEAILTQRPINVANIWESGTVLYKDVFLSRSQLATMCSIPLTFCEGVPGALNLYREVPKPFTKQEIRVAMELASLLPSLYEALRDKITLKLLQQVQRRFTAYPERDLTISREEVISTLQEIGKEVAAAFGCLEVSIFLEDPYQTPDWHELVATTWPVPIKKLGYRRGDKGLTGWVLENRRPIKIFDLAHFERDKELIQAEYEGVSWADEVNIKGVVRQALCLTDEDKLPPLSFTAVPIVKGEKIYGVIRCSVAHNSTYYFTEREVRLLELVADQISHYWRNWLARCEANDENETWRGLVDSIKDLNSYVYRELTREVPNEQRIFAAALRVASRAIKGAEIIDVRLLDESNQELYFAEPHGDAWELGTPEQKKLRLARRYPLNNREPTSAGAYVFKTGRTYEINDVRTDIYYSELFPATKRMIIAPIKVEDKKFGVLDIRGVGERDFPLRAAPIAELIGQQLGMYSFLAGTISELRATKADLSISLKELTSLQKQQIQIFQDLSHQLKSPIMQAHARVQLALREVTDERMQKRLWAIRGLCSKAKRVSYSTELFSALARGEPIKLKSSPPLSRVDLIKLLIEATEDTQLLMEQSRNIQFQVDRESFDRIGLRELNVDKNLFEQAVTAILDNATKYSYRNTVVRISGGRTSTGGFYISFLNRGLPISAHEIRLARQRGWRGEFANQTTGEGSGIGLWIVDHIMSAHDGQLEINPTSNKHDTLVRLIFPSSRVA
jgi:signal transduction histidine kinase